MKKEAAPHLCYLATLLIVWTLVELFVIDIAVADVTNYEKALLIVGTILTLVVAFTIAYTAVEYSFQRIYNAFKR